MGPQSLKLLIWWKSLPEDSEVGTSLGYVRIKKSRKARGLEWRGEGSVAGGVPDSRRSVGAGHPAGSWNGWVGAAPEEPGLH